MSQHVSLTHSHFREAILLRRLFTYIASTHLRPGPDIRRCVDVTNTLDSSLVPLHSHHHAPFQSPCQFPSPPPTPHSHAFTLPRLSSIVLITFHPLRHQLTSTPLHGPLTPAGSKRINSVLPRIAYTRQRQASGNSPYGARRHRCLFVLACCD